LLRLQQRRHQRIGGVLVGASPYLERLERSSHAVVACRLGSNKLRDGAGGGWAIERFNDRPPGGDLCRNAFNPQLSARRVHAHRDSSAGRSFHGKSFPLTRRIGRRRESAAQDAFEPRMQIGRRHMTKLQDGWTGRQIGRRLRSEIAARFCSARMLCDLLSNLRVDRRRCKYQRLGGALVNCDSQVRATGGLLLPGRQHPARYVVERIGFNLCLCGISSRTNAGGRAGSWKLRLGNSIAGRQKHARQRPYKVKPPC
jgi:hypothetical protein